MPFVVASGRIAMSKISPSGKEFVVSVLFPEDLYGLLLAFEEGPTSLSARAQIASSLLLLPRFPFLCLLEEYPAIYRELIVQASMQLRKAHELCRSLAHDAVETRIIKVLSRLCKKTGGATRSDSPMTIEVTRQQIALMAGTTLETAIRATKNMEREGIVSFSHYGEIVILNPKWLGEIEKYKPYQQRK